VAMEEHSVPFLSRDLEETPAHDETFLQSVNKSETVEPVLLTNPMRQIAACTVHTYSGSVSTSGGIS
jgi:hypothetical protein